MDSGESAATSVLGTKGVIHGSKTLLMQTKDGQIIEPYSISAYSATLGIDDVENNASFTYYPNPVKNTLTLNAQNNIERVVMYNMLGQEVLSATPNKVDSELNITSLDSGAYFVKVTISNITKTIRVIKQ